jgi:Flp pilus assembly protein TadB
MNEKSNEASSVKGKSLLPMMPPLSQTETTPTEKPSLILNFLCFIGMVALTWQMAIWLWIGVIYWWVVVAVVGPQVVIWSVSRRAKAAAWSAMAGALGVPAAYGLFGYIHEFFK